MKEYYIDITDNEVIELFCEFEFIRKDRYIKQRLIKMMSGGDLTDENKDKYESIMFCGKRSEYLK